MADNRVLRHIRTEFDYRSYLEATVPVRYSGNGELRINCPICYDEKFKCYVNDDKKYFNCFKCDFHTGNYDVFDLVASIEGLTRSQAMLRLSREYTQVAKTWEQIIASSRSIDVEEDSPSEPSVIRTIDSLPREAVPLSDKNDPDQARFWDYLLSRGFTEKEVSDVKAHCVPIKKCYIFDDNKRLRANIGNRILLPIYGGANKLVSWTARSIDGAEPKYLNAPDSEATRTVWPYVPARGPQAVLVEGQIDALAIRRGGFNTYATLGKKISYDQIDLLKQWGIMSVILFWDKKDAKKEMVKAIDTLKLHFDEVLVPDFEKWPSSIDAGDTLGMENGVELLRDLLVNNTINVNSLEFAKWQM